MAKFKRLSDVILPRTQTTYIEMENVIHVVREHCVSITSIKVDENSFQSGIGYTT